MNIGRIIKGVGGNYYVSAKGKIYKCSARGKFRKAKITPTVGDYVQFTILDENEVEYIKKDGMKVVFHTVFREYEAYSSFNKLESSLPSNFFRCHKSYVINLNNIKNIDFVENRIYFQNNAFCDIGPKYKKSLIGVFDSYGIS